MIDVEVAYSPSPGEVALVQVSVPDGATAQQALTASGLLERYRLEMGRLEIGIWGRRQALNTPLRFKDRVEIYRPLQCDPKEARRLRYRRKGNSGQKAGKAASL